MAENESMEGKDLAHEAKMSLKEKVLEEVERLKNGESKVVVGELEATKIGNQAILKVRGRTIAIVSGKEIQYNIPKFEELKKQLQEEGQTLDDLGLPDLQEEIDKIQKQNSQRKEEEHKEKQSKEEENDEQIDEEEKDDEKPEIETDKDEKKEEIAKKYNVNESQVIHIANDKKITQDERFQGLVKWAKDREDIYIIPGENPYTYKFISEQDGVQEEIEAGTDKVIGGTNPDVTVKRIDGEKITEIKPLAMYEIDSDSSIAIVQTEHGETEAIYCRQQEGNKKEYWGSVIPEASGKNVLQQEPKVREFMDHKYNSGLDLDDKADSLRRQEELEKRGLPSDKEGVQVQEIEGSNSQNIALNIEEIAEDLMKRDGIIDRATVPPGYYENKAQKILNLMEDNENITYEQAVEQVDNQGKREQGGRTPGNSRNSRRE